MRGFLAPRYGTAYRIALMRMAQRHAWCDFVEVGVRLGHTGVFLMTNCPRLYYSGVDPFAMPEGSHAEDGFADYGRPDLESWHRRAVRNVAAFGARGRIIRATSIEAAAGFAGASADAVFVDGDHRREHVRADVEAWLPIVRPGGWLIGHDWNWPSVREAVRETVGEPRLFGANLWGVRA